jgi:hypothetical protein
MHSPSLNDRSATHSIYADVALSTSVRVKGKGFDIASDWHLPIIEDVIPSVLRLIHKRARGYTFICAGDVFDVRNGEDTSFYVSKLLNVLSKLYEVVLYVPGNHCLRSRANPWNSFTFADNVVMPIADEPKIINTPNNLILLGNVFYDLQF